MGETMSGSEVFADVDAVAEAGRYVSREWDGDALAGRYRLRVVEVHGPAVVCEVLAVIDGARFYVAADRWGNTATGETMPACLIASGRWASAALRDRIERARAAGELGERVAS
jgi:hypothetical protein